jgi:RPA family protein
MCDRRQSQNAQSAEAPRRLADHRIVPESPEELRVIGVEREYEPKSVETLLTLRTEHHASVDELIRGRELPAVADRQSHREHTVADATRGIACVTGAECERVRTGGPNDSLEL